jgi:hypothetical protein
LDHKPRNDGSEKVELKIKADGDAIAFLKKLNRFRTHRRSQIKGNFKGLL